MHFDNLKNLDPIYHSKWGKGTVVSVKWRRDNQLLMCWFKSRKEYVFITSDSVKHDDNWSFEPFRIKKEDLKENVTKKDFSFTTSFEDL